MDEIGKGDVYKAERILDTKNVKGKRYFLIKWDGWNDSNNTWEPEKNIIDTRLIDVFYALRNNKDIASKNTNSVSKKLLNNDDVTSKEKDKSLNQSSVNSCKEVELRSVIRIAEGLRPLSVSKSYQSPLNKFSELNNKHKRLSTTLLSDTTSSSESTLNEKIKPTKQNVRAKAINMSNTKSTNRFMRRRKLSSSSNDSSVSSSSKKSFKGSVNRNKKNATSKIEDSEEEEKELKKKSVTNKSQSKQNTTILKGNEKTKVNGFDIESASESAESTFDDFNFVNSANEDVFITDITSGFVTVTIKESVSPEGFFKTRTNT